MGTGPGTPQNPRWHKPSVLVGQGTQMAIPAHILAWFRYQQERFLGAGAAGPKLL